MKLIEKYQSQMSGIDTSSIKSFIEGINVVEYPHEMSKVKSSHSTIVVGETLDIKESIRWRRSGGFSHFINQDRDDFFNSLLAACLLIKSPSQFAKNPLPFFIKDFKLKKENIRHREFNFKSTKTRTSDLQALADFLKEHPKTKNRIQQAHLIADEMMTNAIFNAPVDFNGDAVYKSRPRTDEITLPDHEGANLHIVHDDDRLLISCMDPFGSLNERKFLNRLYDVYWSKVKSAPQMGDGGAGLGCKMMIESSSDFFVIREKDRYTFFASAIPLGRGRKAFTEPKNIHLVFQ